MSFLYPAVLYALIIPILCAGLACRAWYKRSQKWEVLVAPEFKAELVQKPAVWQRLSSLIFATLAGVFAIIAMACPIAGYSEQKEAPASRNILIAIDCSRSMLCKDSTPDRLGRAKTAAYDLLDALPGDNFGVIIFSGNALLLVPLTYDHNAIKEMIEQLQFGWVATGGTNLQNVLQLALKTFQRDREPNAKNALVILSDGEDTVNVNYDTAQDAKKQNLIVITAGIGSLAGTTIPDESNPTGLYRDRRGRNVISKLNPESLRYLAAQTDGQYVQLSDGAALTKLVQDIATRLNVTTGKEEVRRVPNHRYMYFAVPALIFVVLTLLIDTKWRSFIPHAVRVLVIGLLLGGTMAPFARAEQSGGDWQGMLQSGNYDGALRELERLLSDSDLVQETRSALSFAKGCLEQKTGKMKQAAESFSQALLSTDTSLQADAHFNLGNLEAGAARQAMAPKKDKGDSQEGDEKGEAKQSAPPTIEAQIQEIDARLQQLGKAQNHIKEAVEHFNDALASIELHQDALLNKQKIQQYNQQLDEYRKQLEELKKKLEEEKKRRDQQKQQQQQQQNKQDQDQKDQQNQQKDQQSDSQKDRNNQSKDRQKDQENDQEKDSKDKQDQDKDKDKQDEQNQSDKQDKQKNEGQQDRNKPQDKPDKDGKQDQQDRENQQKPGEQPERQGDKPQEGQPKPEEQKPDMQNAREADNKDQKPEGGEQLPVPQPDVQGQQEQEAALQAVQEQEESPEEKERREARAILKGRRDLESGCPVPQPIRPYRPEKDY